jgi:hypothetical protein
MNNANNDANGGNVGDNNSDIIYYYYHDAYQIYELLDNDKNKNNNTGCTVLIGPNNVNAIKDLFIRLPQESKRTFLYGQTLLHKCYETMPLLQQSQFETSFANNNDYDSHNRSSNDSDSDSDSASIIDVLLEFYPDALKKEDDNGRLPIHYLLSPKSRWWQQQQRDTCSIKDLLEQIITIFPDSIVSTTSRDGQLPLHIVCQRTTTTGDANTNSNSNSNSDNNQLFDVIDFLIKCYPDACQYRDNYGKFPFDYALETAIENTHTHTHTQTSSSGGDDTCSPHIQILQLLIQNNPVLLSFPSSSCSISESGIHNNNNNEDEFGNTRSITGNDVGGGGGGDLPIHRIIKECSLLYNRLKQYDPIIDIVLNGFEGCLRIQDSEYQMTPLMLSCTCNNSLSQIYTLLRKWPEQIQLGSTSQIIFDDTKFNGELLYSSLAMSKSITILDVKNWIKYYNNNNDSSSSNNNNNNNSIVLKKDIHGRLPIHYAVLSKSNDAYKIIHYLLFGTTATATANDSTIAIQQLSTDDNNGRLPIHIASASPTCNESILKLLIKTYPDGLLHKDNNSISNNNNSGDGRLPWHYGECSRQDLIFEMTTTLFPNHNECNLDLVPDEIQWDILSVKGH